MSTYTGQGDQEGMRKINFCLELNQGVITSKPPHQTLNHNHQTKVCPLIPPYNCVIGQPDLGGRQREVASLVILLCSSFRLSGLVFPPTHIQVIQLEILIQRHCTEK